jgi:beta-galactosidase
MGMRCKKPDSPVSVERFRLVWDNVVYDSGELKAVAFKAGKKIGVKTMKTAGNPYRLRLTPDRSTLVADGNDLSYVLIEAFDDNQNFCPLANNPVEIKLMGPGAIAGVGNGNPQSYESFQSDHITLFNGKAMVIIRSDLKKGIIDLTATSAGMIPDRKLIITE